MKLILHKIYDGYLFFQFKMSKKYRDEIDYPKIYTQIFVTFYTNAVWIIILFMFLYIRVTRNIVQNRVFWGLLISTIFFIISQLLERHLKKVGFVEEVYEYYSSLSDEEKKQKAKKGLFYNMIPLCVIPLVIILLCYVIEQLT